MNLDWTTFALEVVNFLVLVWLLKHFFYRPVLAVIEQRRMDGEKATAAAQALTVQAQALKAEYEARLLHAAQDHDRALAQLDSEVAQERSRRLAVVDADMAAERQRRRALDARERETLDGERERQALGLALRFATQLLTQVAGPALETSLIDLCLSELNNLKPDTRTALQTALAEADLRVEVTTAYPVSAQQQAALAAALSGLAGRSLTPDFVQDALLKAGLRMQVGAWLLKLNLNDELEFFGDNFHHES